jgi:hypothetical protein
MALKIFLSKTPKMASSDFDNTQVSDPYASTGLIKVLYNFTLFFMTYDNTSLNSSQNDMFRTKVVYKMKTRLLYSIAFPENRAVFEVTWKNIVVPERPEMMKMRRRKVEICVPH